MNFLCDLLSLYCLLIYICIFIHEDSIASITSTYYLRVNNKCLTRMSPQGGGRQDLTGPSPGKASQHDPSAGWSPEKMVVCLKKGIFPPKSRKIQV